MGSDFETKRLPADFEIRAERYHVETMGPLVAQVNGKTIEVIDASDTGFSFSYDSPFVEGSIIDDLSIQYKNGAEIYRGPIKIVWQKQLGSTRYSHGAMLMSGPLSEHFLSAMRIATHLRHELVALREDFAKLPTDFILWVAEVKYFLADLKSKVDTMESSTHILSKAGLQAHVKAVDVVLAPYVVPLMTDFGRKLNEIVSPLKNTPVYKLAKSYFRRELHKFFRSAPFVERAWQKPLGYAGDYEMMNQIYRNESEGHSLFSNLIHKWGINEPSSCSVRARRSYFKKRIKEYASSKDVINIASIACGPAKEIIDILEESTQLELENFNFYLIDQDKEALLNVKRSVVELCMRKNIKPNVNYIPLGVSQIVEGHQLADSLNSKKFDFVYSVGLFDYLKTSFAKLLLRDLLEWTKKDGHLVIGNFNHNNPSHTIGDFAGDWSLILRSEQEMKELASGLSFSSEQIIKDEIGIEIFFDIRK
jgi:extracellular factor (EF) 3-hydroxypalmitic acid methyl ester biosynthesis protein